jgi:DNA-binding transcriptional MerR regulator
LALNCRRMPRRPPKPRRTFVTAKEIQKAAGVSFVTLREWIKRGVLPPPIEVVTGRGNLAKYPRHAVLQADLARRLRAEGWTLDAIAEHMKTRTWDSKPGSVVTVESAPDTAEGD